MQARGLPRRRTEGGLIEMPTRSGHVACVAAVPWASARTHRRSAARLLEMRLWRKQQYADAMQRILAHLAEGFRHDAVNLVVAHSHIAGAKSCGSERLVTMGDEWAATAQSLPAAAQYVALGPYSSAAADRVCRSAHRVRRVPDAARLRRSRRREELRRHRRRARQAAASRARAVSGSRSELGEWAGTMTELERDADSAEATSAT